MTSLGGSGGGLERLAGGVVAVVGANASPRLYVGRVGLLGGAGGTICEVTGRVSATVSLKLTRLLCLVGLLGGALRPINLKVLVKLRT